MSERWEGYKHGVLAVAELLPDDAAEIVSELLHGVLLAELLRVAQTENLTLPWADIRLKRRRPRALAPRQQHVPPTSSEAAK